MNYTYKLYTLSSGHTIVTPQGKSITDEEYLEYFSIISNWLKVVRPEAYLSINPDPNNKKYGPMLNKMFEAYLYDPIKGGIQEKYFLDKRTLAFIYVVSYFIQKENEKDLNPFLAHIMGNALLLWLPLNELAEYYLDNSAEVGNNLQDGFLLVRLFCPNIGFNNYGFVNNVDKALKYASMIYSNPFNEHDINLYDYAYARALYEKDKYNEDECLKIINEKLTKFNSDSEEDNDIILNYLVLGLEICSKVKIRKSKLNILDVESILNKQSSYSLLKNQGYYWLAECLIKGINNKRNINKAIDLLQSIKEPRLYKRVGIALAKLYLNGDGVELDPTQSLNILEMAKHQADTYSYTKNDEDDEKIENYINVAIIKIKQKDFISLVSNIIHCQIHHLDPEYLLYIFKLHLSENELDFLLKEYKENMEYNTTIGGVLRKLKHPVVRKQLSKGCNRVLYIGNRFISNKEIYLNFDEAGNIFVHGWPGSGKTWYFYSLYERLKGENIESIFWSFKPFEFEKLCGDKLIKDPHEFIQRIKLALEKENTHTIVFIDELMELVHALSEEEMEWLKSVMKERKNINFICNSQNMVSLIDQFDECATTRICMLCGDKEEESIKMIGGKNAIHLEKYGEMCVLNKYCYSRPAMFNVVIQ